MSDAAGVEPAADEHKEVDRALVYIIPCDEGWCPRCEMRPFVANASGKTFASCVSRCQTHMLNVRSSSLES